MALGFIIAYLPNKVAHENVTSRYWIMYRTKSLKTCGEGRECEKLEVDLEVEWRVIQSSYSIDYLLSL